MICLSGAEKEYINVEGTVVKYYTSQMFQSEFCIWGLFAKARHYSPLRLSRWLCYPHRLEEEAQTLQDLPSWCVLDPSPSSLLRPMVRWWHSSSWKAQDLICEGCEATGRGREVLYKAGFYNGTTMIGELKGENVQDAKLKVSNK